jgi:hypothetical protein
MVYNLSTKFPVCCLFNFYAVECRIYTFYSNNKYVDYKYSLEYF